jgi:hypothetical protein
MEIHILSPEENIFSPGMLYTASLPSKIDSGIKVFHDK